MIKYLVSPVVLATTVFSQPNNNHKPLLKIDKNIRKYYIRFDGKDDYLVSRNYAPSDLAGPSGTTITIFLIVTINTTDSTTIFKWGVGKRFLTVNPSNRTVYVRWGADNEFTVNNISISTENLELWTIRLNNNTNSIYSKELISYPYYQQQSHEIYFQFYLIIFIIHFLIK